MCNFCDAYSALLNGEDTQTTTLQSEAAQLLKPSLEMMIGTDSQSRTDSASAKLDQVALDQTLSLALEGLQDSLPSFASSEAEYLDKMRLAFGEDFSAEAAFGLLEAWQTGDFSSWPTVAFLSSEEMGNASGAYEAESATIYLSTDFFELYQNDMPKLVALVAEELGHHIDTLLNGSVDSAGDEGAIFAKLLQGKALSPEQLSRLQQEEDQAVIELSDEQGSRLAQVEQNGSQISFENVTSSAGNFISGRSYGAGAWGDFNGDGLPDLWVNNHLPSKSNDRNSGRNLFVNNGDGTFTDVVNNGSDVFLREELRGDHHGSAWADFDNDGDLDLIQLAGGEGGNGAGRPENTGAQSDPNRLYVNEGGVLRDRAAELGLSYNSAKAQLAIWFDYNNDGRLDLFHGSTERADRLNPTTVFLQKEDGTFEDVGADVLPANVFKKTVKVGGLGYLTDGDIYDLLISAQPTAILDVSTDRFDVITSDVLGSGNSNLISGGNDIAFADFNNDLLIDAYVNKSNRRSSDTLLLTNAEGKLVAANQLAGINLVDTGGAGGVVAADFDNDMDIDIFTTQGTDGSENNANILFENQGDGTFIAVANSGGALAATTGVSDNVTMADYDVDGFVDLFATNGTGNIGPDGGPQQLFRNTGGDNGNSNNWLHIDLEGITTNRDGVGAKVYVTTPDGVTQRRDQTGGVHEYSQDHQRLHFGLGQNTQIDLIEIKWPSGIVQRIENVTDINEVLEITEADTGDGGTDGGDGGTDGGTGDSGSSADVLFSLRNSTTVGGVVVRSEDIVRHDGNSFALFFDGSDVGLGKKGVNVDAFTVISDNEILLSFGKALTLEGVGYVDDSDVVKFTATSLGEETAGTFEMYLDGSDVGLTTGGKILMD